MNWMNTNSLHNFLYAPALILVLLFASKAHAEKKEAAENAFVQAMLSSKVTCPGKYGGHLQGMATDRETAIFWSHTVALAKTDLEGKLLKVVDVPDHSGDLAYHDGKLYVATNLGDFNREGGKKDSWIYVYDAKDLSLLDKHSVNEVEFGAGGIAYHDDRFIIIGGLPGTFQENYIYEYDENFKFIKRYVVATGNTHAGVQSAAYHNGCWWFGCYGNPGLLQTDEDFNLVHMYDLNFAWGIIGLEDETFLVGGE